MHDDDDRCMMIDDRCMIIDDRGMIIDDRCMMMMIDDRCMMHPSSIIHHPSSKVSVDSFLRINKVKGLNIIVNCAIRK